MMRLLAFFALLAICSASCPNDCNGHGYCNVNSACVCYRNWQGADCSKRTCYFAAAFVDTPQGDLNADGRVDKPNVYEITIAYETSDDNKKASTTTADQGVNKYGDPSNLILPAGVYLNLAASTAEPSDVNSWALTAADSVATKDANGLYSFKVPVTTLDGKAPVVDADDTVLYAFTKDLVSKGTTASHQYAKLSLTAGSTLDTKTVCTISSAAAACTALADDWKVDIQTASQPYIYATQFSNAKTWEKYPTNHAYAAAASSQKQFYDEAHFYAECSGKGTCNRDTGECDCFEGYTGAGCAQLSCPNACSGHGVCKRLSDQNSAYVAWDRHKTTTCICDPGYTNVDCSDRICPSGDDPITRNEWAAIHSFGFFHTATSVKAALEFKDEFGEFWTTTTLDLKTATAADVKAALEGLPNNVVQEVAVTLYEVEAAMINDGSDKGRIYTVEFKSNTGDVNELGVRFSMTAGGKTAGHADTEGKFTTLAVCPTGADKNCLLKDATGKEAADGTSKLGHWFDTSTISGHQANHEYGLVLDADAPRLFWHKLKAGTTDNVLCSRRGLCDYSTGLCKCFNGFTDDDCSRQNALAMY